MEWITEMLSKFSTAAQTVILNLSLLPDRLDSITFGQEFVVTKFFGLIHYILGTPLYLLFCTVLLIGTGFILYKIAKTLLNIVVALIPGLKGRIYLP